MRVVPPAGVTDGWPFVVPVGIARDRDRVLCHGSTGARLFRGLAEGEPTCLTVTIVDGLVLARSQFESSMNYRSAMILGRCEGDGRITLFLAPLASTGARAGGDMVMRTPPAMKGRGAVSA